MSAENEAAVDSLKAQIESSQTALLDTLRALSLEVKPSTQAAYAKQEVKFRAKMVGHDALTTIDEAREGDEQAELKIVKTIAITSGVVVGVVLLCTLRRALRAK